MAEASNRITFVDSEGTIDAIQDVTVRAFTAAKSSACVNGVGQARAATSQLSQAIGVAFAKVSALALAVVTPTASETEIVVKAVADSLVVTTVDGRTATDVVGIGEHQISLCTNHVTCLHEQLKPMRIRQVVPMVKDASYLVNDTMVNQVTKQSKKHVSVLRIRTVGVGVILSMTLSLGTRIGN